MTISNVNAIVNYSEAKTTKYNYMTVYEYVQDRLNDEILCSGLNMPTEFFDGLYEAYSDIWHGVLCGTAGTNTLDDEIALEAVINDLYFEKGNEPKTLEEITAMYQDLRLKRDYHEYLQQFEFSVTECGEINSQMNLDASVDTTKAREWAIEVVEKYGLNYLHIEDFFEFGYQYGLLDWLDWVRYFFENPNELFNNDC